MRLTDAARALYVTGGGGGANDDADSAVESMMPWSESGGESERQTSPARR